MHEIRESLNELRRLTNGEDHRQSLSERIDHLSNFVMGLDDRISKLEEV